MDRIEKDKGGKWENNKNTVHVILGKRPKSDDGYGQNRKDDTESLDDAK